MARRRHGVGLIYPTFDPGLLAGHDPDPHFRGEVATVAGEARNIDAFLFPILPKKFRFAVEITVKPSAVKSG